MVSCTVDPFCSLEPPCKPLKILETCKHVLKPPKVVEKRVNVENQVNHRNKCQIVIAGHLDGPQNFSDWLLWQLLAVLMFDEYLKKTIVKFKSLYEIDFRQLSIEHRD